MGTTKRIPRLNKEGKVDNKLMLYLLSQGAPPAVIDRLMAKMEQQGGSQPIPQKPAGFRGTKQTQIPGQKRAY